jgi:hypothetical protein
MSKLIQADCPSKFLSILPFDFDIVDKTEDGKNVTIEFEDEALQPQNGLRICADLHGPSLMALTVFNGTKNLKSYTMLRQIESDPSKKGQPTYVMGMPYQDLKEPRKIDAPIRVSGPVDFDKMTNDQLKAYAKENSIDISGAKNKTDLIAAITAVKDNQGGAE